MERKIVMRLIRDCRGSLTVEAAVILPVFLGLMMTVINFTNVVMIYIAMDHAVSETAKQIATHAYPLKALKINGGALSLITGEKSAHAGITGEIFNRIAAKGSSLALETVVKEIARERIREMYPLGELDETAFEISGISVYNPNGVTGSSFRINNILLNNEDIALMVEYRVSLSAPFFGRTLRLSNTAVERAWADGKAGGP